MFAKLSALTSIVLAASTLVRADVVPSEPGPGAVYTAGETCTVSWDGDRESDTLWKDMSIQFMTGSNYDMVHIDTIASDLDGTVSGRFSWPCPEVDPYATIYFYQFTSPHTSTKTWTTRFTITSPDGETVEPEFPEQPGTGDAIPWGIGNLVDPSGARPPPVIGSDDSDSEESASAGARPTASSNDSDDDDAEDDDNDDDDAVSTPAARVVGAASGSATGRPAIPSGSALPVREEYDGAASASGASLGLVALAVSAISLLVAA
ncbi:hypothetical protein CC1G_04015 [Coprinopsis cinerea okayama7|uniref:Yeast cell wall synthesis Kre9/Knh1-like N-terminal domain-containing protein n=1 Tax=Coprinopsis cinerea (strain Okayama-7 / 130 / ATCC MYA-4618 / FGSC 9003) TaxID=240176 RepID=A8N8G8_COPC7|nr:hypothetical protein CC1G_04015 [Coprinopsis cinerea okayama7\|eukprot:XP_001831124.1 hypothetical protein CC1G_04015 [Coprinopsis cinerea okayama7\